MKVAEVRTVPLRYRDGLAEASAEGATEAEARAALRPYIAQSCRPGDGQYFIFCDPPR